MHALLVMALLAAGLVLLVMGARPLRVGWRRAATGAHGAAWPLARAGVVLPMALAFLALAWVEWLVPTGGAL